MPSAACSKYLLVEDVGAMRALVRLALNTPGCEITEAGDLKGAKRILSSRNGARFDCVILDLELPDGNGLDLVPEIGEDAYIIALTADDRRETTLRCLEAGCKAVIDKSGGLADLAGLVSGARGFSESARNAGSRLDHEYLRHLAEVRIDLERAARQGDLLQVRRIAHQLRGTAIHFGHAGVSQAAQSVNLALASGKVAHVNAEADLLITCIGEALEACYPGSGTAH